MRKPILLIIAALLVFSLFACSKNADCESCSDGNEDGICDTCGKEISDAADSDITLIENGEAKFNVVLSSEASSDVKKAINSEIRAYLRNKHGIDVALSVEGSDADIEQETELLVGRVKKRGEKYEYDGHTLGKKGYVIKTVGSKIIINAGSDEKLIEAIEIFADNVLGVGEDEIDTVIMTASKTAEVIQDDYKITSLKVNGEEMTGYTIAADILDERYLRVAESIRDTVYEKAGYWFEIVGEDEACERSVVLLSADAQPGEDSFKVSAEGKRLIISCGYDSMLESAVSEFVARFITLGKNEVNFMGKVFNKDISVLYYEDFGAVGDGVTDDYKAIYLTHEAANESGQTVRARDGATYYISNSRFSVNGKTQVYIATIKTNVEWGTAKFIIDDRNISPLSDSPTRAEASANIFNVLPDDEHEMVKITDRAVLDAIVAAGLNPQTTKIDLKLEGWDGPVMIIPNNSSHKIYRRRGFAGFTGGNMHEVIVLDKDGNVSEETPIVFNYESLDYIEVYKLDESSAITVSGGEFTTRASQANLFYNDANGNPASYTAFVYRGIGIQRAFTTVKNVKHYVTDEIPLNDQVDDDGKVVKVGVSYYGFLFPKNTNHITLEDCVLTGRRCYIKGSGSGHDGTYDFYGNNINKIVLKNCTQSNFWVTLDEYNNVTAATKDTPGAITSMSSTDLNGTSVQIHWGIGGTNYCKNMEYIGSTLSRFDAHSGLYGGKIIDSTINYMELIGGGNLIIENVTFFASKPGYGANAFIALRNDYGCTWDGEISVKNLNAYMFTEGKNYSGVYMVYYNYVNWYFGYTSAFPTLTLDNVDFYDIETGKPLPAGFKINLTGSSISSNSKQHLLECHTAPVFALIDADGDGLIDEPTMDRNRDGFIDPPCDLDGDGVVGKTSLAYAAYINDVKAAKYGVTHPDSNVTLNITKPPRHIKIINNDGVNGTGGYTYVIKDTSGYGISDGGYYDNDENYGGFYGDTKFIYGEGEGEYFLGTDHPKQNKTATFSFE
ncbi:MAG: hypothetical protein E7612_09310 [Ruminococcaceae bacterium]|nr:hypothetical protein [Oscillospiraceae bacterium]